MKDNEEFVSRKLLKKYKNNAMQGVIKPDNKFKMKVHDTEVYISGEEIILFARSLEKKYREYVGNSFVEFLPDGMLSKKNRSFSGYTLGAAICKYYNFDVKRFIEAQYYYHDSWKSFEPSLNYITSLHSEWNSVGRYRSYCDKFRDSIDYFSDGSDNISPAFKSKKSKQNEDLKEEVIRQYEQMIQFQMDALNKTKKEVLVTLAHPLKGYLPLQYLRTVPEYMQLLEEGVWGDAVDENIETKKMRLEIQFGNQC